MRVINLSFESVGSDPRQVNPLHSISTTLDVATSAPLFTLQTGTSGIPFTTVFKGNSGYDNTLRVAATLDSSIANFLELGFQAANSVYFVKPSSTAPSSSIPNLLLSSGGATAGSLLLETNGKVTLGSSNTNGIYLSGGTGGIQLQGGGTLNSSLAANWSGSHTFTGSQFTIVNNTANSGFSIQAATTISKPLLVNALTTLTQGLNLSGNTAFTVGSNVTVSLGSSLNVVGGVTFQNAFTLLGAATLGSSVSVTNDLTVGGKGVIQGLNGLLLTQGGINAAKGATFGDRLIVTQGGFSLVGDGSMTGNTTATGNFQITSALLVQGNSGITISQGPLNITSGNLVAGGSVSVATGLSVLANGITTVGPLNQSGGNVSVADGNFVLSAGNLTMPLGSIDLSATTTNAQHINIAKGYLQVGSYATFGGLITGQAGLILTSGDTLLAGRLTVQGSQTHLLGTLVVDNNTSLGGTLDVTGSTVLHTDLTVTNNLRINGADGTSSTINTPLTVTGAFTVGSAANKVYLFADGSPARFDTGLLVTNFPVVASSGLNVTGTTSLNVASTVTSSFAGATSFGSTALVTMAGGLSITAGNVTLSSTSGVTINGGNLTVASSSSSTFNGTLTTNSTVILAQGASITGNAASDIFTARSKFQNAGGTFLVDNTGVLSAFSVTTGAISATAIAASSSLTAPILQNSSGTFQVSQSGYLTASVVSSPSFTNPAGSFSVDASGNITGNSINVPAISTTSGIYTDYVKARQFLNTNSTFTVDQNGALVASSIVANNIQNAVSSPSYLQDINGNVTLKNLTATGSSTGTSATYSGLVTVANLQNAANTASISASGTIVAKILQNALTSPTLFTDQAGNLTTNSLTATTSVTGATANWTSGVTSASYVSSSGTTSIDNNGVITTVKIISPTLTQALTNPTWSILSAGSATFAALISPTLAQASSSPTWSIANNGNVSFVSGTFTGSLSSTAWSNANASVTSGGVLTVLSAYIPSLASSTSSPTWSISGTGAAVFASAGITNTLSAGLIKGTSLQNTNGSWTVDSSGNQVSLSVVSPTFANAASNPTFSVSGAGGLIAAASTFSSATVTNTLSAALLKGTSLQNTNSSWTVDSGGNQVAFSFANAASAATFTVSSAGALVASSLKGTSLQNANASWTVDSGGNQVALSIISPTLANAASNPTFSVSSAGVLTAGVSTFSSATVTNTLSAALVKGTSLQNTNGSWTIDSNGNQVALSIVSSTLANAASSPSFSVTGTGVLTAGASTFTSATVTNTLTAASLKGTSLQNTNGSFTADSNGNVVASSLIAPNLANAASSPTFTVSSSGGTTVSSLTTTGLIKGASLSNTNGSWVVSSAGAVNGSTLTLTGGLTTGTTGITLGNVTIVPATSSSTYTLSLPSALPGTASNLQVSSTGVVSYGSVSAAPSTSTYTTPTLPVTTATNVTGLIMSASYTKAVIQVSTSGGQIARYFLESYVVSNVWYMTTSAQGTNLGINFQIGSSNAQVTYTMSAAFGTTATFNIVQNP